MAAAAEGSVGAGPAGKIPGVLGKALKKNTKCSVTNLKAQVYIKGKETPYSQMK